MDILEKAMIIYDDVMDIAETSAMFNILAIAKYLKSLLLIQKNESEKALLLINDALASIQKTDNQSKIMYAIFEKTYLKIIKEKDVKSVDIETEELKLKDFSILLKRLIED